MNHNTPQSPSRSWICFQIGAREHYAIARALQSRQRLQLLATDYWYRESRWSDTIAKRWLRRFQSRFHPDVPSEKVTGWNRSFLVNEVLTKSRFQHPWDRIIHRNHWFQKQACDTLRHQLRQTNAQDLVVFAYSYAAREVFRVAKEHGCHTVLGQIDPGIFETKLVNAIARENGRQTPPSPPETYWEAWKEECELSDVIVVNSSWSQDALIQTGIAADKIRIIPLAYERPADIEVPDRQPVATFAVDRPLKMLFLGQVIVRKGVMELIQAMKQLQGEPVHLTVVGGGDSELMDELKTLENTTVVGHVDRPEVVQHYQDSDIFLLPTHSDGYAITQLEAAAFGLPILSSRFCGDVVVEGQNGQILPEVTVNALVTAIRQLLQDPQQIHDMSLRQRQMKIPGIDDLADELVRLEQDCFSTKDSNTP